MIVAIAGLKGGIGKTLVSLHLAGEAFARGLKVLLADADPQRSALTWADVAAERKQLGPTVIGVSTSLHQQLPQLASSHDLTLIDCPPRGDVMTNSALMFADLVLFPAAPAPTDFWALDRTIELLQQAQALRPELRGVLLLNRIQPRQRLSAGARAGLQELGLPVLETTLGSRTAFAESVALGQTIATHSPRSEAAAEIRRLLDEVMEVARG